MLVIAQIYIHPTTPTFGHCRYYTQVSGLVRELQGLFYSQHELKYDMYCSILYPIETRKLIIQPILKRKAKRSRNSSSFQHTFTHYCVRLFPIFVSSLALSALLFADYRYPGIRVLCPPMLGIPPHPCLAC